MHNEFDSQKELDDFVAGAQPMSCGTCMYMEGAVSWWCANKEAAKARGTLIPGVHNCPYYVITPYVGGRTRRKQRSFTEAWAVEFRKLWRKFFPWRTPKESK
jgi:hypothetical protein